MSPCEHTTAEQTVMRPDECLTCLRDEHARLTAVVEAAERYGRAIREWETNRLPLPPTCADGTCGAKHAAPNEWEHAEEHFMDALNSLDRAPAAPHGC